MRLSTQLLIAMVGPAAVVLGVALWAVERTAGAALDRALGERLTAVAAAAVTRASTRVLLLQPGDDATRTAKNLKAKLNELQRATGVARIQLVRAEDDTLLVDSIGQRRLGDPYLRARFDRYELDRVAGGESSSSVLFEGPDGRPFKTGYAPLAIDDEGVVVYAAVSAPADYTDELVRLRQSSVAIALLALTALALFALATARRLAVPLARLAETAEAVGFGQLDVEVPTSGPSEAQVLGQTMQAMIRDLKARDTRMQMMLAGIAHEVRNPLGGIELFGGLLREDIPSTDPRREYVDRILTELQTLSATVNDFLEYARERPAEVATEDARDLVERATVMAESRDKPVEIITHAETVELQVDGDRLGRALLNVLRNAVQAAPEGGTVRCTARRAGEMCEIAVEDSGPGVPEEAHDRIFEPFFTTKEKGTGLGLALVKKTVLDHGGTIEVDRSELGGARFVIRVPTRMV